VNKEEIKQILLEYAGSYRLGPEINRLGVEASSQSETLESLGELLSECNSREKWQQASGFVSGLVHALVKAGTSKSMLRLLGFVRSLPDDMPFGAVELIGTTLPSYGKIITGPAKELCTGNFSDSARAIGLQTLCNLYLDDLIEGDHVNHVAELIQSFEEDEFFSSHLVDLVKAKMRTRGDNTDGELDVLVEF
jgi:hypothetical protein